MSVTVRQGTAQRTRTTSKTRGDGRLAEHRRSYDRRRRSQLLSAEGRDYAAVVRLDPCSYCGGRCGQMAADHIVPLDQGGENTWQNLTGAGRPCNASKKNKPLLHWLLERKHDVPTG